MKFEISTKQGKERGDVAARYARKTDVLISNFGDH